MLFELKNDIAEEKEISATHPEVVKELEALLNRYRDGGYSRELPPAGVKPKAAFEPLPPLKNAEPVDLTKFKGWTQRDGGWFAKAGDKGVSFSGPLKMQNVMFRLSDTPGTIAWAGRPLGADNDAVYGERGLSADERLALAEKGVL